MTQLKDSTSHNSNKAASIKSDVDTLSTNMNNMNISDSEDSLSKCAERGKEEEILSNKKEYISCAQNVEHTSGSKTAVEHLSSAEFIPDDILFRDPPPKEDCPLCMQPMPYASGSICGIRSSYQACCGKVLCCGCCIAASQEINKGNMKAWCPFCRMPFHETDKEYIKRFKKRMKLNDADAFLYLGMEYRDGGSGLPQDYKMAFDLWNMAAELGSSIAHHSIAFAYAGGKGVEEDNEKAIYHFELAAIGGHEAARNNLGMIEEGNGNMDRAMKHFIIAARCGFDESLSEIGKGYKAGHATKDEYASTLRAYQVSIDEMKSEQRTKFEEHHNHIMCTKVSELRK